jgi:hypothetical protein
VCIWWGDRGLGKCGESGSVVERFNAGAADRAAVAVVREEVCTEPATEAAGGEVGVASAAPE